MQRERLLIDGCSCVFVSRMFHHIVNDRLHRIGNNCVFAVCARENAISAPFVFNPVKNDILIVTVGLPIGKDGQAFSLGD